MELAELMGDGSGAAQTIDLMKKKEETAKRLQMKAIELEQANSKNEALQAQINALEFYYNDCQNKIKELEASLVVEDNEKQRELRKKEKLERDLKQAKDENDNHVLETTNLRANVETLRADLAKQTQQFRENKLLFDKFVKDNSSQQESYRKLQNEMAVQEANYTRLASDLQFKNSELRIKDEELNAMRQDITKLKWTNTKFTQKVKTLEDQKNLSTRQLEIQKNEIASLDKEFSECRDELENMRKEMNEYLRMKDTVIKGGASQIRDKRSKNKFFTKEDENFFKMKLDALLMDMKFLRIDNSNLRKHIRLLQRVKMEKIKCVEKADMLTKKIKENNMAYNLTYADMERKNHDMKGQIKEINTKLESIRVERNTIAKNSIEARAEMAEMKTQMSLVTHQVDQLREQNSYKDAALLKERHENQQLVKNIDNYKDINMKLRKNIKKQEIIIKHKEKDVVKLMDEIEGNEQKKVSILKERQRVIAEKNIIGSQLIRRNDEIALLYEKIKLLEDSLNRGQVVYNRRLEDIRILKMEIKKLRCTNLYMAKGLETMEEQRREIFRIQQENLLVRTRCKVLEDELENPLNIHRWRKLKGSDPSLYEMMMKMQWLQKRLIKKTELVIQKEKLITEKELLFTELKKSMARQSGPETLEELANCRSCLRKANSKIKALQAEVRMYKSMSDKCKEQCLADVNALKEKYLKLKMHQNGLGACLTPIVLEGDK